MTFSPLIPQIERRLDTWIQVHDNLAKRTEIATKFSVTLSREYGCEAYPLAENLSEVLSERTGEKWNIFDHAVIEEIASNERISEEFLKNLGDSSQIFDIIMANMVNDLSQDEAYQKIVNYITKVALLGNAIIVGRGSSIITRNFENCFHFRLEAPRDFREKSIARRMDISLDEAKQIINEKEQQRSNFIAKYFSQRIDDKSLYHAVFNNERNSISQMTAAIEAILRESQ